jgi:hypothetical protein
MREKLYKYKIKMYVYELMAEELNRVRINVAGIFSMKMFKNKIQ